MATVVYGFFAALVVAPYYNRPDGRLLEAHFRAVADEGDLPIVVYNVPSRTGTNLDAETFLRLAEHPRVVAVKEASGNLEQIARICRDRPRDVAVLAGDGPAVERRPRPDAPARARCGARVRRALECSAKLRDATPERVLQNASPDEPDFFRDAAVIVESVCRELVRQSGVERDV